jgi:hypothetical protein
MKGHHDKWTSGKSPLSFKTYRNNRFFKINKLYRFVSDKRVLNETKNEKNTEGGNKH